MPNAAHREITRLRLRAQALSQSPFSTAADAVRWMLAIQAQDIGSGRWSVGARAPGLTEADVTRALADGQIVRSWPMRGTLHLTAPEDLGWMLAISRRRQAAWSQKRRDELGLTAEHVRIASDVAVERMTGGVSVRRDRLIDAWAAAGVPTTEQRAYHLLWGLAHDGLIVFGAFEDRHPTFALFEEWIGQGRDLAGDEALAEFASRYFRSHGPATDRDLAWWASITLGDARRGIAASASLQTREFDGVTHWMAPDREPAPAAVHALSGFDEYLLGYQDRSAALEPRFADRIVPGGNGVFRPTIVSSGRVIGTWRAAQGARETVVTPTQFLAPTQRDRVGFERAMRRYGTFVGSPVRIAADQSGGQDRP